ncbi:MAG: rhomboid family intramembrane serine protease [Bdellovibrionaceae bacterium]|nr:rhomboid family intramembrane serine protease [Pseudobdellovibrionaceae bacterium]
MIFPWPKLFLKRLDINFVNILILANVLLFFMFFTQSDDEKVKSKLFSPAYAELTTHYYFKYLNYNMDVGDNKKLLLQYDSNNTDHRAILSSTALRDKNFIGSIENRSWDNDEVRWGNWKKMVAEYQERVKQQTLFMLGLSQGNKQTFSWFTYQFSHMNLWHLFSNMLFLFLIGYALESLLGAVGFVMLYIFSGIAGGLFYLYFNPTTLIPMVGASGAVSGLISFYAFYFFRKNTRFYYFLSPSPNNYGPIYLPTFVIIPMYLVPDLASFAAQIPGVSSGVAFSAHLGGALFGGLLAFTVKMTIGAQLEEGPVATEPTATVD